MSHSYSPLTRLMYVFARDERRVFTKNVIRHGPGDDNNASPDATISARAPAPAAPSVAAPAGAGEAVAQRPLGPTAYSAPAAISPIVRGTGRGRAARFAPEESWGKVVAIDPLTGDSKWEHKVHFATMGRCHVHGGKPGFRRHDRRRRLRARCADWRTALVFLLE